MYKAPSKQQALKIATDYKQSLVREHVPVVDVMLFGSLARGSAKPGSDIDIAVIYRKFDDNRWNERMKIRRARTNFSFPMDIISLREEDFNDEYSMIARELKKGGIAV